MIRARAPGKVVLWGEYAVLAGAPALVLAVDRYATCEIGTGNDGWRFRSRGFAADPEAVTLEMLLAERPPPVEAIRHLAWHVLQALDGHGLPRSGDAWLDTAPFWEGGVKLGLGSSAALCVAVYAAFARLLGQSPDYLTAQQIHRRFQGGTGSGIDVAAAWHGGALQFRRPTPDAGDAGTAADWPLPASLEPTLVFTGASASTRRHLERFERWRAASDGIELERLCAASAEVFEPGDRLQALRRYVDALDALDRAAGLGIFSPPHRRLGQLAIAAGVVYKPCGAGGGDIGAAFSPDSAAAERFVRLAVDDGFLPLALETACHGIEVTG